MINLRSIGFLGTFFFISFTSYGQHGSGGAGALGSIVTLLIILSVAALFGFVLLVINIRAYLGKLSNKSMSKGIFMSIIYLAALFLFVINNSSMFLYAIDTGIMNGNTPSIVGYTLVGIVLSLLSTFHLVLASQKLKTDRASNGGTLDD